MFMHVRQTELCILESWLIRFVEPVQFWILGREIVSSCKNRGRNTVLVFPFLQWQQHFPCAVWVHDVGVPFLGKQAC